MKRYRLRASHYDEFLENEFLQNRPGISFVEEIHANEHMHIEFIEVIRPYTAAAFQRNWSRIDLVHLVEFETDADEIYFRMHL